LAGCPPFQDDFPVRPSQTSSRVLLLRRSLTFSPWFPMAGWPSRTRGLFYMRSFFSGYSSFSTWVCTRDPVPFSRPPGASGGVVTVHRWDMAPSPAAFPSLHFDSRISHFCLFKLRASFFLTSDDPLSSFCTVPKRRIILGHEFMVPRPEDSTSQL